MFEEQAKNVIGIISHVTEGRTVNKKRNIAT